MKNIIDDEDLKKLNLYKKRYENFINKDNNLRRIESGEQYLNTLKNFFKNKECSSGKDYIGNDD